VISAINWLQLVWLQARAIVWPQAAVGGVGRRRWDARWSMAGMAAARGVQQGMATVARRRVAATSAR